MKNRHEIFCVAKKGVYRLYLVYLVLPDKLSNKLLYNVNRHFENQLIKIQRTLWVYQNSIVSQVISKGIFYA